MIILFFQVSIIGFGAWVSCTISGTSYLDKFNTRRGSVYPTGFEPSLYWFPKSVPEVSKVEEEAGKPKAPIPLPIPVPLPPGVQMFPPIHPMFPPVPPMLPPVPPMLPPVPPMLPPGPAPYPMPLPYGLPIAPTNPMLPAVPYNPVQYPSPYQFQRRQAGMVPGIPGLVTSNGGINVMPFSDVYSDMLDKIERKKLNKKLRRVLGDYEVRKLNRYRGFRKYRRKHNHRRY